MSGRVPVPASLKKQLGKYLMAAKSFKKISSITALYCKLWALDIAKSQFNNETKAYILQLADDCIAEKNALDPSPEDAKKAIRATGANIFMNIYNNESSMSAKDAAKGYRDCFVCFEILKHPNLKDVTTEGELEIYKQNAKYLTFKAASVLNPSIIKDEAPEPPPGLMRLLGKQEDGMDEDTLLKELDDMEMDTGGDPWASWNSTQEPAAPNTDEKGTDNTNDINMDSSNINNNNNNNNNNYNDTSNLNNNTNPYYGNPYYGNMGNMGNMGGMGDPNSTMSTVDNPSNDATAPTADDMLPSPPANKPNAKPEPKKQPSYQDLTKKLPTPKYDQPDASASSDNKIGQATDLSSYLSEASSEESKMWAAVKNGQKYQKECGKTMDEAIYCLMLGEPDFRGAMDIAGKVLQMINLCRQSVGLKVIKLPNKPPTDIPADNMGDRTNDWFGNVIGTKRFFRLQELSFDAETRLKKAKRHIDRGELPGMETFVMIQEAISMLQPVAAIQPAWQ